MSTDPTGATGQGRALVLAANARMPSQRAQSVQLARAAFAFSSVGLCTTVVHARRRDTPAMEAGRVWEQLGAFGVKHVKGAARAPELVAANSTDWIDLVPRALQFAPARWQEFTFGRCAVKLIQSRYPEALVLARDIEVAHGLRGRDGLALELHRVPGGKSRRRWLMEAVDAGAPVVAISGGVREDLVRLGVPPERITVEHDAVDPVPSMDRAAARAELGLDPERPVVLYAGGLLRWKGVDVAVDAARYLGDAQLVIVGGMEADVAALRRRVAGLGADEQARIRIDGYRPAPLIPTYLCAADVGVVPNRRTPRISSHYTSPLKVFEAMGAGLALVVSDLPSLRDAVGSVPGGVPGGEDGDLAIFVEPEDPEALGSGIQGLLDDPAARGAMADRARAAVSAHTWEARAGRILTFMTEGHRATS